MLPRLDAAVTPVKPADGAGAGAAVGEGRQAAFQRAIQSLVGQTVSAEVMSKLKDGSFLVKVAENSVRMALPADTQVGGKVPLTVLSAQPRPTFQLGNAAPGSAPTVLYTDSGVADGGDAAGLPSQGTAVYVPGGGKPAAGTAPATPQTPGGAAAQDGATAADGEVLPGQLKPGANAGTASSPTGAPATGNPAASARPGLPAGTPDANDAATPAGQPGRPGAAGNPATATPGAAANPAAATPNPNPAAAAAANAAAAPSSSAAPNAGSTPNAATPNPASASNPGAAAQAGAAANAAAATPRATPNLPAAANAAGLANPAAAQGALAGTPNPAGTPAAPAGAAQLSAAALAAGDAGNAVPADGVKPQTLAATLLGKAPLTPSHELPELGANAQQATLSSAARVLTNVLSTAAGQPGQMMQLALVGKTALFGKADPDTADLANKLHETISKSGLFYESHVAEWVKGERPLAELMREPQMQRLLQQGQESLARTAANGPDLSAAQMINQQLHTQEQNRVLWNGQAWPGQQMQWEVRRDEREGGKGGSDSEADAGPVWRSGVRFRLPLLGDVSAAVTMIGEQVHIQVQTGEADSALTLRAWAGQLESALAAAGAQLSSLTISQDDEARP